MFEHFYCESEKKKKNKHFKCYVKMDYIYFKQGNGKLLKLPQKEKMVKRRRGRKKRKMKGQK